MERYILMSHWGQLVHDFKETETDRYDTEMMARDILDFIQYSRIRQWTLFVQRRGEDFEKMIAMLDEKGYDLTLARRFVENEELWKITLEMAETS
jgi:hypothetical protein